MPLLSGTLLEDVTPNADGELTIVPHKLGRPWRGYFVVRQKYSGVEKYTSTAATPTTSSLATLTHGLGGRPLSIRPYLVALSTDHGHSVGDVVELGYADSATASRGLSLWQSSSAAVKYAISSVGIVIVNPSSFATVILSTVANWQFYVECLRPRTLVEVSNRVTGTDATSPNYLKGGAKPREHIYFNGLGFTGTDKVDLWVF